MSVLSSINNLPQNTELYYDTVIDQANGEYGKYAVYVTKLGTVGSLASIWATRHDKLIDREKWEANHKDTPYPETTAILTEYWEKVDIYIGYQDMRSDTQRIIEVYKQAIDDCKATELDRDTLVVLKRLRFNIDNMKQAYAKTLGTDLDQLKDQQKKMTELFIQLKKTLPDLRRSLEPLSKFCYNPEIPNETFKDKVYAIAHSTSKAIVDATYSATGYTAYLNADVRARRAKKA